MSSERNDKNGVRAPLIFLTLLIFIGAVGQQTAFAGATQGGLTLNPKPPVVAPKPPVVAPKPPTLITNPTPPAPVAGDPIVPPTITQTHSVVAVAPVPVIADSGSALKATVVVDACTKAGATKIDAETAETLTCVLYTKLGALKGSKIETRWANVYANSKVIHKILTDALVAYHRSFPTEDQQLAYEKLVVNSLEFGAFVDLLVVMDKKTFPGFADYLSRDTSLADAISPWAQMLAQQRELPLDTFNTNGEAFLTVLGNSSVTVTQEVFDKLFLKSETLRVYADSIDEAYWLNFPNPTLAQIALRFGYIDSLLTLSTEQAKSTYLKKIQTNANNLYPKFASVMARGSTMATIMTPWVSYFAAKLELYQSETVPIGERTLLKVAMSPPSTLAEFDAIIALDARWPLTTTAKALAAGKPSF
ncbi:MAG: hypothetical protein D4R83_00620 [Streptomycetaceae bacterium]|nr:MAG: hypothetical protein D4R83_00620 [Streptomycetaceae bacterium]